jgi:hypothetical protein
MSFVSPRDNGQLDVTEGVGRKTMTNKDERWRGQLCWSGGVLVGPWGTCAAQPRAPGTSSAAGCHLAMTSRRVAGARRFRRAPPTRMLRAALPA